MCPFSSLRISDPSLLGDPRLLINLPRKWLSHSLLMITGFYIMYMCGWFPTFTICMHLLVNFPIFSLFSFLYDLYFSAKRISFSICFNSGLVVLNSPNFCLSLSNLNRNVAGYCILGCRFFTFTTLNALCHSLWPAEFLLKNQLISLWGFLVFHLLLLPCFF